MLYMAQMTEPDEELIELLIKNNHMTFPLMSEMMRMDGIPLQETYFSVNINNINDKFIFIEQMKLRIMAEIV